MIPLIHGFIKINNFKHKKKHFQLSMCVIIIQYVPPLSYVMTGKGGALCMYVCSTVQDTRGGGYLGR